MGHVFGTLRPLVAAVDRGSPIRVRETTDSATWQRLAPDGRFSDTRPSPGTRVVYPGPTNPFPRDGILILSATLGSAGSETALP